MLEVVLASYNKHKAKEIQDVFKKNIKVLTLDEIGYKEKIEENGETLLENAKIKAEL